LKATKNYGLTLGGGTVQEKRANPIKGGRLGLETYSLEVGFAMFWKKMVIKEEANKSSRVIGTLWWFEVWHHDRGTKINNKRRRARLCWVRSQREPCRKPTVDDKEESQEQEKKGSRDRQNETKPEKTRMFVKSRFGKGRAKGVFNSRCNG